MIRNYKYKLKPNKKQDIQLQDWLNICRFVYNLCLEYKTTLYTYRNININKYEMLKEFNAFKLEFEWLCNVHTHVLQDVIFRLYKAYDNFFKGGGFPKFAKKGKYKSFSYKTGAKIMGNKIKLPKIGEVKFFNSRKINGVIKKTTLINENGKWFVILSVEEDIKSFSKNDNLIGVDLGIKELMITSDSEMIENPKTLYKYLNKLKIAQQSLARKKKGSNNRRKQIKEIQKIHEKVTNIRKDYRHKVTTNLIKENQVIICEDLKIKNMIKNHKLSKAIVDASWYTILNMLEYKSYYYGRTFYKVNPKNTSKNCSVCGCTNDTLTLKDREWVCNSCGTKHERDINAAINILNKGLKELGYSFVTCGEMEKVIAPAQESS